MPPVSVPDNSRGCAAAVLGCALQRAARSQISTAVSFEGARAAGSAALPSRSLEEESALSAAEGDGERRIGAGWSAVRVACKSCSLMAMHKTVVVCPSVFHYTVTITIQKAACQGVHGPLLAFYHCL
jgi:hypothetical protein